MQRTNHTGKSLPSEPQSKKNPLIETIQTFFYNTIVDLAFERDDISTENIKIIIPELIKKTIESILRYPRTEPHVIYLPTGQAIHRDNCPTLYLPFLEALLKIKPLFQAKIGGDVQYHLDEKITAIAVNVANVGNFKNMLNHLCNFILESKGLELLSFKGEEFLEPEKESPPANIHHALVSLDTEGVDLNLIRQTFYKKMLVQTLAAEEKGWIPYDDLEGQDPYIYLALPALVLIDALGQSQFCTGIRLNNNKMLVAENCPAEEGMSELFKALFQLKDSIKDLSEGELNLVKWLSLNNDREIPVELQHYHQPKIAKIASVFSSIATEISRRPMFHNLTPEVLENCCRALDSQKEIDSRFTRRI